MDPWKTKYTVVETLKKYPLNIKWMEKVLGPTGKGLYAIMEGEQVIMSFTGERTQADGIAVMLNVAYNQGRDETRIEQATLLGD